MTTILLFVFHFEWYVYHISFSKIPLKHCIFHTKIGFIVKYHRLIYFLGTAGNSLSRNNNMSFTTRDVDNDKWKENCARARHGAWWFKKCAAQSHLNGEYLGGAHNKNVMGIQWRSFKGSNYSYKIAEMKVGPGDICKSLQTC